MIRKRIFNFLLMYISFFVYSVSSIFSKLASGQEFLSKEYILFFIAIIIILGIYAILWQQILKRIPLSIAMSNKPITLILSILWAFLMFKENITIKTIIGIFIILLGIYVVGRTVSEK